MRIKYILFLLVILFYLFHPSRISADNSDTNVSISDAVSADLAIKGYLDNVSVSYDDGNPTNVIAVNNTKHWLPASTVKLFAAMYAFKQISDHKLSLNDTATAQAKNVVTTELVTDELPIIQEGDTLTIDRLIRQMITQSDNTAFNILLDVLDRQKITQYIHDLGLTHSAIGSKLNLDTSQEQYEFDTGEYGINTTTSDDYTKAFILIKNNKIAGAKNLFEILKQQKIRYMIPLFLPKNVIVANKHGDLDPLYHDGGIIVDPDNKLSYVLSIFTNLGDPNYVAHLSDLIYTKNYDLVGEAGQLETQPSTSPAPLDPILANINTIPPKVLGANTTNIIAPSITAADLGITARDLSLVQNQKTLPVVLIPADSPLHFLIPTWQLIKKTVTFTPQAQTQLELDNLSLQLAEAKDQEEKGNTKLANEIFRSLQDNLTAIAHSKTISADPIAQTRLQSTSETRFSILGTELKQAKKAERPILIKEIAVQAKSILKDVQPFIPDAYNATNPSQKPLVGEVVNTTASTATVKTAGGQEIVIPLDNPTVIIRNKGLTPTPTPGLQPTAAPNASQFPTPSVSPLKIGTTVALIGSSHGRTFSPSFILTNLPTQLVAPAPVTVVKVNTKNKTIVVAENGVAMQVNITSQTVIKGSDTNVSLKAIKPGDIIVVHGQPLTSASTANAQNAPQVSSVPTSIQMPSTIPANTNTHTTGIPSVSVHSSIPTNTAASSNVGNNSVSNTVTTKSITIPQASTLQTTQQNTPPAIQKATPQVIQSTSIQVLEKAQDVKPQHQETHQSLLQSHAPAPQPQSKPAAKSNSSPQTGGQNTSVSQPSNTQKK